MIESGCVVGSLTRSVCLFAISFNSFPKDRLAVPLVPSFSLIRRAPGVVQAQGCPVALRSFQIAAASTTLQRYSAGSRAPALQSRIGWVSFPISSCPSPMEQSQGCVQYSCSWAYMTRGLVWAQWYFASGSKNIEDEDGSHSLENDSKRQHHAARVPYLGMILAAESDHLRYDRVTRQFFTVVSLEVDELVSTTLSFRRCLPTALCGLR